MNESPTSFFVRNRPIRTAYFIDIDAFQPDSQKFQELLEGVIHSNHKTWGGRKNPLIFFKDGKINEEDWRHLELADVDCLTAFKAIPKELLAELDERLHPLSVAEADKDGHFLSRNPDGIVIHPTPEIIRLFGKTKLLLFEFVDCDPLLRRFIELNFGVFDQWIDPRTKTVRRDMLLEQLLSKLDVQTCKITDRNSLAAAITELAGTFFSAKSYRPPLAFTAPCELASVHLLGPWPDYQSTRVYQLIIGDSPADIAEHWNSPHWKGTWSKPYKHQLWLPTSLAHDAGVQQSLMNWLRLYSNAGNSDRLSVEFTSSSCSPEELEALRQAFCNSQTHLFGHVAERQYLEKRRRDAEEHMKPRLNLSLSNTNNATRYSLVGNEATFLLQEPSSLANNPEPAGGWMADFQIEHRAVHSPRMPEQHWWVVPRRCSNELLHCMFHRPTRVNGLGLFSVSMQSKNYQYYQSERIRPEVKLYLPSDATVVQSLITSRHSPGFDTCDPRYKALARDSTIDHVTISDKGEYLAGMISSFGDFWTAKHFCERRVWRHIFNRLASRDARKDANLKEQVRNLIFKTFQNVTPTASDKSEYLALRILEAVGGRLSPRPLPFSEFKNVLDELNKTPLAEQLQYPQGDTIVHHHGLTQVSEEELHETTNDLVAMNVLRLGVSVRCSFCRIPTWYHVDDLKQNVTCSGCGHSDSIGANRDWAYALNNLAAMCVAQNQLAVMQALAELSYRAHHSFFYSPSLNLFKERDGPCWHEIDVAALVDGEFVVGEVKDCDVTKTDFEELLEIAKELRPQRAYMFMPDDKITKNVVDWASEADEQLRPFGGCVQIFALPTF